MRKILMMTVAMAMMTQAHADPACDDVLKRASSVYNAQYVEYGIYLGLLAKARAKDDRPQELLLLRDIERIAGKLWIQYDKMMDWGYIRCKDFNQFKADFDAAIQH
jgi:hypothetical protein